MPVPVANSGDQKRKRGRPRKQQMPDATLLSSGDQKQKRGRPRKYGSASSTGKKAPKKKETVATYEESGECNRIPLDEERLEHYRTTNPNFYTRAVEGPISFAINQINAETGHNYKLVHIPGIVYTQSFFLVFLTFTAADVDGEVRTFKAKVSSRTRGVLQYELDEWKNMGKR